MAEKQTDADKAQAMREYREKHDADADHHVEGVQAPMRRIAALRAARLARDAAVPTPEKAKSKRRS